MGIGPEMVRAWALEAEELFVGKRVARVEGTERTLSLHFAGARSALLFSWDPERCGCCLVDAAESGDLRRRRERIPPLEATLKAHISGARLDAARRLRWDRILCLTFRRRIGAGIELVRSLLFEATGRYANLMLLDEGGRIIEAVKHVPPSMNRTRTILPGNRYAPPPGIRGENPRMAAEALRKGEPLPPLRGVGRGARLLLERWGELPGATPGDLAVLLDLMEGEDEELLPGGVSPGEKGEESERAEADHPVPGPAPKGGIEGFRFFLLGGDPVALPFPESSPLGALPEVSRILLPGRRALEVMRSAILIPMVQGRRERLRGSLLEGLDQRIALLDRKIDEGRRRGEEEILRHRWLGEALIASMHLLPPRARSARLEIPASDGTGTQEVEIEWEPGRSPSSVAQDHFARYRRLRDKRQVQLLHLRRAEEERAFLAEERVFLENAETEEELRLLAEEILGARSEKAGGRGGEGGRGGKGKKGSRGREGERKPGASGSAEAARPYRRYDRGEAILYLGTSAKGNRQVVFRLARPEDWWFHTADAPGGHVILRTEGQEPEEELFRIAASLAADHGRLRGERTVRVDATLRKNVRSIPQAGPADVTYRDFRSFFVDPTYWRGRIEGPR